MSASGRNRVHSSRRGFVMVTMILSLVILMAFLGLAIDVGYEQYVKVRMQTAADAAALGGHWNCTPAGPPTWSLRPRPMPRLTVLPMVRTP